MKDQEYSQVNYFVKKRRDDKLKFLEFLRKMDKTPVEKRIALFSLRTGFRIVTLNIWFDELQQAGLIE